MRIRVLLRSLVLIIIIFLCFSFQSVLQFVEVIGNGGLVYKAVPVSEEEMAVRPVQLLITNLKSGQWQMTKESFSDEIAYQIFVDYFKMDVTKSGIISGGLFESSPVTFAVTSTVALNRKNSKGNYLVALEVRSYNNPTKGVLLRCFTAYDQLGRQYFIKNATFTGDLPGTIATADNPIQIPDISKSPCVTSSSSGHSYIRLSSRNSQNGQVEPALVLGENPNVAFRRIPEDFYGTDALRQEPFQGYSFTYENPKWKACSDANPFGNCNGLFDRYITQTYYPGNVISQDDADENKMGSLFVSLSDADGVLDVPNSQGISTSYPVGLFLDSRWKRLKVLSSKGDQYHYGNASPQGEFSFPVAVAAIGKYFYVLDQGKANTCHVFDIGLNKDNKLVVNFKGTTNLGLDLKDATDMAGFATPTANVIYITNSTDRTITRVLIDPATGFQKAGEQSKKLDLFINHSGETAPVGEVGKIAVSPRNGATGKAVIMVLSGSYVYTFSSSGLDSNPKLDLNFRHELPLGSFGSNIGYNQGNNTFNVTDVYKSKVHIFSGIGEYLGSGGRPGQGETSEELYYPSIISSNTFNGDALEMIVGSAWGAKTGFKRFFPKPDIGNIEVIERAPAQASDLAESMLSFRFAITSGYHASSVQIKLNGQIIKAINSSLLAGVYAENFLTEQSGSNGIKGILKPGWNSYEVQLTASVPGPANIKVPYERKKSIEFYHALSTVDLNTPFVHDKADNPLIIYKNTFISGKGSFSLSDGKTIVMPGCTLSIAKGVQFRADREEFQLHCGSNIEVNMQKDTLKTFQNCYFNGFLENYNMVSCKGEYTGGKGKGSGGSSKLEFISCRFDSYIGKALYLIEGRATVVNCTFESTLSTLSGNALLTASAVALDPDARIDILGGQFINNDIAVDASAADVYIGHNSNNYKSLKLTKPIFRNNRIALYTFGGHSAIQSSEFVSNSAAIIGLSGSIDVSKNSDNLFQDNVRGIIFSDVLLAGKGKNLFINNGYDITYLAPPGELAESEFDLQCNFWEHQGSAGLPFIDIINDPVHNSSTGLITFQSTPYLVRSENGYGQNNKVHYTCTNSKTRVDGNGGGRISKHIVADSVSYHPYHLKLGTISGELRNHKNTYNYLAGLAQSFNTPLTLGRYPSRTDTIYSFDQALSKSLLSAYIYTGAGISAANYNSGEYNKIYSSVITDPTSSKTSVNYYVNATDDKLAFLKFFLKGTSFQTVQAYNSEVPHVHGKQPYAYPNPANDQVTIQFESVVADIYTIELFSNTGLKVSTILKETRLPEGTHTRTVYVKSLQPGLYYVKIQRSLTASLQTIKIIKN